MPERALSEEQIRQFDEDGYLIIEELFDPEEMEFILQVAHVDPQLAADTKANKNFEDDEGLDTVLAYRGSLTDDIYSAYGRYQRIVGPMEELLRGEVFHYYTLIMQKNPQSGGWQYHQDYGYHYQQFLFPSYAGCMVALNPATRDNGCLKVYKGSNRLGRIDHRASGSQLIADPERLALAADALEEVYCELEPGSVLYYHSNTLHASDPNLSSVPRWTLIYGYVASTNVCIQPDDADSQYAYLDKMDAAQVGEAGRRHWEQIQAPLL
jgi:ectoine hydroxylase-related dioxygenase (phytanoyl-CoA dioxygenase family)